VRRDRVDLFFRHRRRPSLIPHELFREIHEFLEFAGGNPRAALRQTFIRALHPIEQRLAFARSGILALTDDGSRIKNLRVSRRRHVPGEYDIDHAGGELGWAKELSSNSRLATRAIDGELLFRPLVGMDRGNL
jgi:hypothetical protein